MDLGIFIDTCVLPRSQLETGRIYRERFGSGLGFELLMMFDLPDFEEDLKKNLDFLAEGPLLFHEPVWGVEHAARRGSPAYEEGMYHLRKTREYARILRPADMVYHLNNGPVPPGRKDAMLRHALENLDEIREWFSGTNVLVENTGTRTDGTMLLDQAEFTDLCRDQKLPVLIDVGHANANGWDLRRLITDLKPAIGGFHLHNNDGIHDLHHRLREGDICFDELLPFIAKETPEVPKVIEYTNPALHGGPLTEDVEYLMSFTERKPENGTI